MISPRCIGGVVIVSPSEIGTVSSSPDVWQFGERPNSRFNAIRKEEPSMKRVLLTAALVLLMTLGGLGQTPTGTLQGVVTDESGALISDAEVTITNIGTAEKKEPTT